MPKTKKPFLSGYKTYKPDEEGFGNPDKWRDLFQHRMGLNEAKRVLKDRNAWQVLEINQNDPWHVVRKAYRRLALKYHPDVNKEKDAASKYIEIQAAYEVLEEYYREKD